MRIATFVLPELVAAMQTGSASGAAALDQLNAALVDPGAFRLTGLPVSDVLLGDLHAATRSFFERPLAEKAAYRHSDDQYVGWCGGSYLSQYGSKDHKEMFHIGPRVAPTLKPHGRDGAVVEPRAGLDKRARATCGLWPEVPEDFVRLWHEYYAAMQRAAAQLGSVLAHVLGVPPSRWFDAMDDNWADLAANYYPPVTGDGNGGAPIYNAAHSDLTVFTILYQDQSRAGGLSVEFADGEWCGVEPVPGTYVVNVGELLSYLSGGRWRAAPHQVTVSDDAPSAARLSIPFFYRPSDERVVRCFVDDDAEPIAVGDWVLQRKRASRAVAS